MRFPSNSILTFLVMLPSLLTLTACEPFSLTLLGVGASAGVAHQMGGLAYRTFTAPQAKVKNAALLALKRMGIKVESVEKTANGETIYGLAADRKIEIEIEAVTQTTTRIRAVARKNGVLVDSATAVEIITQTEKALGA